MSTTLWIGPRAPWADALGTVRYVDAPPASAGDADLVVVAGGTDGLAGWLRLPHDRLPVLAVAATPADEDAALAAGADAVVATDAGPDAVARAVRHARARWAARPAPPETFRLMVEGVPDLVTVVGADGRTEYASPAAAVQTGRLAAELVGRDVFDVVHRDDRARAADAFARAFETGAPATVTYRSVGPDGRERTLESVGRTGPGLDGQPRMVIVTRDVTDRAETERRLVASEARFRAVVEALPDVVSRIRADGLVADFHVPEAFATEFPARSLIGRRLQDKIPVGLAAQFDAALAEVARTGRVASYGYRVEVNGRTCYREVRVAPVPDASVPGPTALGPGGPAASGPGEVISMLRDVTALRENEQALKQSQSELRALAAHLQDVREEERTRLSREVHDVLGQQLTAIRLGIGWFGRHYADDDAAQARLTEVRQTVDDTIRHVRQIAADLRPGVLDDFGLASAAEWQAKRFEERTAVPCAVDVQGRTEPPREVATAAFRVLQEALTNVARHADAGRVALTVVLGPSAVRLVVADDGRGFDADAGGRQSLGLVGMRERARALGGALDVRGVAGQGTVVECTLPFDPTLSEPTPPDP